jgi:hypothetical protein
MAAETRTEIALLQARFLGLREVVRIFMCSLQTMEEVRRVDGKRNICGVGEGLSSTDTCPQVAAALPSCQNPSFGADLV